jgi:nucleotide-binding universal stress UspA family protein
MLAGKFTTGSKKIIGKINEIIVEEAQNADLVIMSKRSEHFHLKEGRILGSITEAVVRHAAKPAMIIPDKFLEIESMGFA